MALHPDVEFTLTRQFLRKESRCPDLRLFVSLISRWRLLHGWRTPDSSLNASERTGQCRFQPGGLELKHQDFAVVVD